MRRNVRQPDNVPLRPCRGSSAVEVLIVTVLLTIIGALTSSMVAANLHSFSRETSVSGLQRDLASAHEVLLDEAMMAGYSPDGLAVSFGTFMSVTTGTNSDEVQFIADIDSDGDSERILYETNADGELLRAVSEWSGSSWDTPVPAVLATDLQAFTLTFLDENRSTLTAAQVTSGGTGVARHVRISMSSQTEIHQETNIRTLTGEVSFRN